MESSLICEGLKPTYLAMFDFANTPALLFYAYIPTITIALFFSFFVLKNNFHSKQARLIVVSSLSFVLWMISVLLAWTAIEAGIVYFAWQMITLFQAIVFLSVLVVVEYFAEGENGYRQALYISSLIFFPIVLFTPSGANITGFELATCEGVYGGLWTYLYFLELFVLIRLVYLWSKNFFSKESLSPQRVRSNHVMLASVGFLIIFGSANFLASLVDTYVIELFSVLGYVIFFSLITYSSLKFETLRMKVLSAEILVYLLILLVASLFLVVDLSVIRVIVAVTAVLIIILGYLLIRSVRSEVNDRDRLAKLADNLDHANARLKELDALKSEFVSLASHQMRGPLGAIKGYVSLISEGELGEASDQVRDAADKVSQATNSLMIMVEDFLNVSRIEQGRMKYVFKKINLVTFVEEAVLEMKPSIEAKKLSLTLTLGTDPVYVEADEAHLKQVCINLIDNAIKYTSEGGITVTITKHVAEGKVHVRFTDTGVGISPDMKDRLFQKFSRAKEASQVNAGGTGLGLYVAKEMMRAHKGSIWIESFGKGKGATFVVELPLVG